MRTLVLMAILPLAACVSLDQTEPTKSTATGICNPNALTSFIGDVATERFGGEKASAETGAAILQATGAKTLRWGGPGMAMTMDFRADRVTVSYDEAMTITQVSCG